MINNISFLLYSIAVIAVFHAPLKFLLEISFENELYSHIPLILVVSIYLIITQKREIFENISFSKIPGTTIIASGIMLSLAGMKKGVDFNQNDLISLIIFGMVLCLVGGFILFYGLKASRLALFPLLFLLFMVPVPEILLGKIIRVLQICSAEVSFWIFKLTGVPIFRDGFTFYLPGLNIEVAEQCSGIRSSLVLFIVSLLAGHMFLTSTWRKVFLSLSVVPITIVKNSLRIVTLSILGIYVDPAILDSVVHKRGGYPFFAGALILLGSVLWLLKRSDSNKQKKVTVSNIDD